MFHVGSDQQINFLKSVTSACGQTLFLQDDKAQYLHSTTMLQLIYGFLKLILILCHLSTSTSFFQTKPAGTHSSNTRTCQRSCSTLLCVMLTPPGSMRELTPFPLGEPDTQTHKQVLNVCQAVSDLWLDRWVSADVLSAA